MKIVKVKPFGVYQVTDKVIETIEQNVQSERTPKESLDEIIHDIKKTGSGQFIGINPETKHFFSFIPIIENGQFFSAHFPDPIQLYYSLAFSNYQFSRKTRHNITFQKDQGTYVNFVNQYLYNWHLQYKISTIIFLHSTIEAFINYLMPEDFIYKQVYTGNNSEKFTKQTKEYNKEQTEKNILFKEKIKNVVLQLTQIDFPNTHQKIYVEIIELNKLRNDIIHLRSTKENNQQYFEKVFEKVINIDLTPSVDAVKDFINTIKPNYIEIIDVKNEEKEEKFDFNFSEHSAFRYDISIFLKILEVPTKKVFLNIPKSNDDRFQFTMNWITQNLDILAQEQLIYFPTINEEHQDKIVIEILKTDKQVGSKPTWDK